MPTRRDRQFTRLVCLCFALVISHQTYAQTAGFAPTPIQSVLTEEIESVQGSNYEAFELIREKLEKERAAKIKALSQDEGVMGYLAQNFNINGNYGELKSGQIVSDWTSLASTSELKFENQSIKGSELAGAYSVWRERTLAEAQLVTRGGSVGVDTLFESSFIDPTESMGSNSSNSAATQNVATTKTGEVLDSESDWEQWAKDRGMPAAGASLMALWGIYVRRRQLASTKERVETSTGYDGYGGTLKQYWDKFVGGSIEGDEVKHFQQQLIARVKAEQAKSFNTEVSRTMKAPVRPINLNQISQLEARLKSLHSIKSQNLKPIDQTYKTTAKQYQSTLALAEKYKKELTMWETRVKYYADSLIPRYEKAAKKSPSFQKHLDRTKQHFESYKARLKTVQNNLSAQNTKLDEQEAILKSYQNAETDSKNVWLKKVQDAKEQEKASILKLNSDRYAKHQQFYLSTKSWISGQKNGPKVNATAAEIKKLKYKVFSYMKTLANYKEVLTRSLPVRTKAIYLRHITTYENRIKAALPKLRNDWGSLENQMSLGYAQFQHSHKNALANVTRNKDKEINQMFDFYEARLKNFEREPDQTKVIEDQLTKLKADKAQYEKDLSSFEQKKQSLWNTKYQAGINSVAAQATRYATDRVEQAKLDRYRAIYKQVPHWGEPSFHNAVQVAEETERLKQLSVAEANWNQSPPSKPLNLVETAKISDEYKVISNALGVTEKAIYRQVVTKFPNSLYQRDQYIKNTVLPQLVLAKKLGIKGYADPYFMIREAMTANPYAYGIRNFTSVRHRDQLIQSAAKNMVTSLEQKYAAQASQIKREYQNIDAKYKTARKAYYDDLAALRDKVNAHFMAQKLDRTALSKLWNQFGAERADKVNEVKHLANLKASQGVKPGSLQEMVLQEQSQTLAETLTVHPIAQFLAKKTDSKLLYEKYGYTTEQFTEKVKSEIARYESLITQNYNNPKTQEYYRAQIAVLKQGKLPDIRQRNHRWNNEVYSIDTGDTAVNRLFYEAGSLDQVIVGQSNTVDAAYARAEKAYAELKAKRGLEFDQKYKANLSDHFTAAQIAEYEALKTAMANTKQQTQAVTEAQNIVQAQRQEEYDRIVSGGKSDYPAENLVATKGQLLGGIDVKINANFEEPFYQAWRRFPEDQTKYQAEVARLIPQAKENFIRETLKNRGIPAATVLTKEVRDHLEDPKWQEGSIQREMLGSRRIFRSLKALMRTMRAI